MSSSSNDSVLDGWVKSTFASAGFERDVYRRGSGPGIVLVHEIPGITPKVTQFANELVDAGFTVVMPLLVGEAGREVSNAYVVQSMAKVCVSREFSNMALNQTSPIIAFLRALARNLHNELGGPGVGALGMCFSGGFALGMMVDDIMIAPVLSQPSMPFAVGIGKKKAVRSADLNLSPDDALTVARRAAEGCQVLGLRYTGDPLVGTRFETLRTMLGDAFIAVELPSDDKKDHSVLTEQRDEPSVQRVLEYFKQKLQTP
ncbi:MAG TPA: dienelactone hydrolase family protein [Ilumatobacteraceae bacterium]|nr:dienelactone hydrolase family protein [Ilumatobacteraceae bacterium]HRB03415.1 dienelactone hydrolase family protein [Ilumatobacteraceae bacterium]